MQPLNDHPVRSYLFWITSSLSVFALSPSCFSLSPSFPLFSTLSSLIFCFFFFSLTSVRFRRWVPLGPLSVIAFLNSMLVALRKCEWEKKNSSNALGKTVNQCWRKKNTNADRVESLATDPIKFLSRCVTDAPVKYEIDSNRNVTFKWEKKGRRAI